jgi:hypothetical protein
MDLEGDLRPQSHVWIERTFSAANDQLYLVEDVRTVPVVLG